MLPDANKCQMNKSSIRQKIAHWSTFFVHYSPLRTDISIGKTATKWRRNISVSLILHTVLLLIFKGTIMDCMKEGHLTEFTESVISESQYGTTLFLLQLLKILI